MSQSPRELDSDTELAESVRDSVFVVHGQNVNKKRVVDQSRKSRRPSFHYVLVGGVHDPELQSFYGVIVDVYPSKSYLIDQSIQPGCVVVDFDLQKVLIFHRSAVVESHISGGRRYF